jgi:hypothetical protein
MGLSYRQILELLLESNREPTCLIGDTDRARKTGTRLPDGFMLRGLLGFLWAFSRSLFSEFFTPLFPVDPLAVLK